MTTPLYQSIISRKLPLFREDEDSLCPRKTIPLSYKKPQGTLEMKSNVSDIIIRLLFLHLRAYLIHFAQRHAEMVRRGHEGPHATQRNTRPVRTSSGSGVRKYGWMKIQGARTIERRRRRRERWQEKDKGVSSRATTGRGSSAGWQRQSGCGAKTKGAGRHCLCSRVLLCLPRL